ncbi:MAG: radical SAM protein [Pseudomonadota bacterium]
MKVLFVYSNRVRDLLPAPPIGLSYVASATEDAGHEVRFVDLLMSPSGLQRLKDVLNSFQPAVVGISVRNIDNVVHQRLKTHLDELSRQIAVIREHSQAEIVLGGPAISILGSRSLAHIEADFAVLGEGEQSFPALLNELEGEQDFTSIPGVCFRRDGEIVESTGHRLPRFGPSGMQRWIDWKIYERQGATWPIQCKRGCPLHCTYCTYPTIEGRAMRKRPPAEVVEEIKQVARTVKPRCFEFIDSVFNQPESYAIELCEEIIRSGLRVKLTTMGVNPRALSRELLSLMKRAGFNSMMITPESASDRVLEEMRKGFLQDDVKRCAELVRQSGIPSMWFFMLGARGETRETANETVSFVEQHLNWKNCLPMFTTGIRLLPGTELSRQARADGYLRPDQDLAESIFYFSPQVSERWLLRRVNKAIANCPTVVHAAEDPSSSSVGSRIFSLMHLFGVSPPYWRFIPRLLSLPFVHNARKRQSIRVRAPHTTG